MAINSILHVERLGQMSCGSVSSLLIWSIRTTRLPRVVVTLGRRDTLKVNVDLEN